MSNIIVRTKGKQWEKGVRVSFADEGQLQTLLYESPQLIPTENESQSAVFTREAGLPGSGYTDLIGVDESGNILVVETKLARNGEIRRKVIGQVLEYAAYLWGMSFSEFDSLFVMKEGKTILDLLEGKSPGLLKAEVQQKIENNLAAGAFQLIIAVDEMNPELEKIIAYVSSRGSGLKLEALELELFHHGELEVLVPHRYGQLNQPDSASTGKKPSLSIEEIIQSCPNEHSRRMFRLLDQLWRESSGNFVKPGTVGASFQTEITGKYHPVFWTYPDCLQNALSDIAKRGAPKTEFDRYRQAIAILPGFNKGDVLSKSQPITNFSVLSEDTLRLFLSHTQDLVNKWRNASEISSRNSSDNPDSREQPTA